VSALTTSLWLLSASVLASAAVSALVLRHVVIERRWLAARSATLDRWGDSNKPHSGGVAFTACALAAGAVAVALWGAEPGFVGVLLSIALASVFGIADELLTLSPPAKLALQGVVSAVLVSTIGPIFGGVVGVLLTVLWLVALLNALNMFDNTDGAAGTTALIVSVGLACSAALAGRLDYLLLCGAYIGSLLAFLRYNLYPSRVFMGDIGSFQLAAFLGGAVLQLSWAGAAERPLLDQALQGSLVFLVLFLDVALVCAYRIHLGRSPFRGDTNHLSHLLIEQLRDPRRWTAVLGLVTAALVAVHLLLAHGSLSGTPRAVVLLLAWGLPATALAAAYRRGLRARRDHRRLRDEAA